MCTCTCDVPYFVSLHIQDQCTALLKACQNKHVSVAKRLCQRNFVDVNAPNKVFIVDFVYCIQYTSDNCLKLPFIEDSINFNFE